MPWLRLWVDILDDPDLHELPNDTCWGWALMLAAVKRTSDDGTLPPSRRLSVMLHQPEATVTRWINELIAAGMIDEEGGNLTMHGWGRWQGPHDTDSAERSRRYRIRQKAKKAAASPLPPAPPSQEENRTEERSSSRSLPSASQRDALSARYSAPATPDERSEEERICDLAATIGGDIGWASWVSNRLRIGDSTQAIEAALSEAVDAKVISTSYVGKILKRYAREGVPELKTTSKAAKAAGIRPTWGQAAATNGRHHEG